MARGKVRKKEFVGSVVGNVSCRVVMIFDIGERDFFFFFFLTKKQEEKGVFGICILVCILVIGER